MSTATDPLAVLGIHITEPIGVIERVGDGLVIGSLIVPDEGAVEVIPRQGITDAHHDRLTAAAAAVWLHGRDGFAAEAWQYDTRIGWVVNVVMRTRPSPSLAAAAFSLSCRVQSLRLEPRVDLRPAALNPGGAI